MPGPSSLLRPRDGDALRAELRRVAVLGDVPVLFGGEVHGDTLLISEYHGVRTGGLRGLAVRSNSGLGGASMVAGRPLSVADYRSASSITHDYDGPVLSEGIRSVLAVPVLVDGRARAMLYGAYRSGAPFGGRAAELMVDSARRLSEELRIRDEVDRRLRLREAHLAQHGGGSGAEQIREVHAELRRLAVDAPAGLQERLRALADTLTGTGIGGDGGPPLTPRELDVLVQVALG
ncbi:helix-turn-helix transcriptional regulator, partial [Mycobacterium sp. ITM-2017-0098]